MKTLSYPDPSKFIELSQRPPVDHMELEATVSAIIEEVRERGDAALRDYTKKFDRADIESFVVDSEGLAAASERVETSLKEAIDTAAGNIEDFHRLQASEEIEVETAPGVLCRQKSVAIERVGLYVPGGSAPLFSTVLMLAIPAKIAGCREIVLCTPPGADGTVHPAILYAAHKTGLEKVYRVGGVQAVAAMAYGTESIPRVYKIFGPGNRFVMTAKQLLGRTVVAIDMPAGPSELALMADESAEPRFIAADLLSQAEHGPDSQVIFVTRKESLIERVKNELDRQLEALPRKDIARKALDSSRAILLRTDEEMYEFINTYAPEHLIIAMKNHEEAAARVVNAGSVFLGNYSPESVGDYSSGTNHTLPTGGFAAAYNGVNLDSFVKKITFQRLTAEGLRAIGPATVEMARAEGLTAHARAVEIRLEGFKSTGSGQAK